MGTREVQMHPAGMGAVDARLGSRRRCVRVGGSRGRAWGGPSWR